MIALLALMTAMQAGNEAQWVTGRIQDRDPVASFLTWDFSSVILRATCKNGEVIVDYYGDNVVPRDAAKTALFVDGSAFEMRRTGVAEYAIDAAGIAALQGGQQVEFDASNEMDEPWHLGQARALKTLAATCSGNEK